MTIDELKYKLELIKTQTDTAFSDYFEDEYHQKQILDEMRELMSRGLRYNKNTIYPYYAINDSYWRLKRSQPDDNPARGDLVPNLYFTGAFYAGLYIETIDVEDKGYVFINSTDRKWLFSPDGEHISLSDRYEEREAVLGFTDEQEERIPEEMKEDLLYKIHEILSY